MTKYAELLYGGTVGARVSSQSRVVMARCVTIRSGTAVHREFVLRSSLATVAIARRELFSALS
jgi:hypothetical protein